MLAFAALGVVNAFEYAADVLVALKVAVACCACKIYPGGCVQLSVSASRRASAHALPSLPKPITTTRKRLIGRITALKPIAKP
jgi:hypothetical protein